MSTPTSLERSLLASAERPDALLRGVLVVRWCVLAWLLVLVASGAGSPLAWPRSRSSSRAGGRRG